MAVALPSAASWPPRPCFWGVVTAPSKSSGRLARAAVDRHRPVAPAAQHRSFVDPHHGILRLGTTSWRFDARSRFGSHAARHPRPTHRARQARQGRAVLPLTVSGESIAGTLASRPLHSARPNAVGGAGETVTALDGRNPASTGAGIHTPAASSSGSLRRPAMGDSSDGDSELAAVPPSRGTVGQGILGAVERQHRPSAGCYRSAAATRACGGRFARQCLGRGLRYDRRRGGRGHVGAGGAVGVARFASLAVQGCRSR